VEIRVYGPGCARCSTLEQRVFNALASLDVAADVRKISSLEEITDAGVMATPGLVINGKLYSQGRLPSEDEIKTWLRSELGE
jgi:small redox-active disulfide protein 2